MQLFQLFYHFKNTFDTHSKLKLSVFHNHPLGVEKMTTLARFIFESNLKEFYHSI